MKRGTNISTARMSGALRIIRPVKRIVILLALAIAGLAFSGCATKYGCPVPGGVQCRSISEVYAGAKTGRPVDQVPGKKEKEKGSSAKPKSSVLESPGGVPPDATTPLRSAPKVLRVWVAPWIDRDGDLHQKSYLYVVVDTGRWAIGLPAIEPEPSPVLKNPHEARPGGTPAPQRQESQNNGK